MKMTTFGPVSAAGDDLSAAVKEAIMRFGAFPRLVILFIPASADGGKIVSCVRSVTDLPLAGATITVADANGMKKTTVADTQGRYALNVNGMVAPLMVLAVMIL